MGYTERFSLAHIEYFVDSLDYDEKTKYYESNIVEMLNNLEVYYKEKRLSDEKYKYLKRRLNDLL